MESSNNSYMSYNNNNSNYYYAEEEEKRSTTSSSKHATTTLYSSLHAVRERLIMKKKPIAPFPPTKPKVYKVHPTKFKELVQRLTAPAPARRLDEIAPPPLDLMISPIHLNNNNTAAAAEAVRPVERNKWQNKYSETCGGLSPLGFGFSPSGIGSWPFSPLLSPGTLSSLDHATVL